MTVSVMTIFVLLVVLIDCMNAQITHPEPLIRRYTGKSALIKCTVDQSTSLQSNALHVYRAKPGEAFQRVMLFASGSKKGQNDAAFPRRFSGSISRQQMTLTISALTLDDAAVYYCALWSGDKKVFGSGTRLYVTNQGSTVPPKVSVYPLSSAEKNGKSAMICQAKGMIPDLVELLWEKKTTEGWTTVSQDNVVEQKNEKPQTTVTSMVIVDKNTAQNNIYRCSVTHEGFKNKREHYELTKDEKEPEGETQGGTQIMSTCAPSTEKTQNQISDTLDQTHSLSLFVYAYGVMLMKNGIYFCAVFIFLLKRKAGKKDASS
ncbi:immunoglobulin kappa light chain-like isoform X4 [Myxocyprinus asiaticus]|uniref:immunoglobulin kappa light chain-like isoform X4 n=1 Tax=Myxocyprinus asiaticus TaxID=70543 RepID=UPI0022218BCD|nr:immunoglobulin kappa light chain-like isoform X4 [Myxocyprinus asiaticus]